MSEENTIRIILEAHEGRFQSGMRSAMGDIDRMHGGMGKLGLSMGVVKSGALAAGAAFAALGVAAVAGIGKAIKAGMELEQQMVSMRHFIANTAGPGTSPIEVTKMRDDYLGWLRKNAALTPFETKEVVGSGAMALSIANGDIERSKKLIVLAEDMAALKGKTVDEAMQAIGDAQLGQFDRLPEFGFTSTQKEFKESGGDIFKLNSVTGTSISEYFKGGAAELSETATGKLSTVAGMTSDTFSDMGLSILNSGFKESLGDLVTFIDSNSGKFTDFANVVGGVIGKGFTMFKNIVKSAAPFVMDTLKTLANTFGESFSWIAGEQDFLKQVMQDGWGAVKEVISVVGIPTIVASIKLIGSTVHGLYIVFKDAYPVIVTIVKDAWGYLEPVFTGMFGAIDIVVGAVNSLISAFDKFRKMGPGDVLREIKSALGMGGDTPTPKGKQPKKNALGTSYFTGGLSWVGEKGPELLNLPTGSQIIPNHKTNQYLGQQGKTAVSSPTININIPKLADRIDASNAKDVDALMARMKREIVPLLEAELEATYFNFGGVS